MPQQSIGSTSRTLSSTDTDRNPQQKGCSQLVASYNMQEDTLGLFYFPGPTGGILRIRGSSILCYTMFLLLLLLLWIYPDPCCYEKNEGVKMIRSKKQIASFFSRQFNPLNCDS